MVQGSDGGLLYVVQFAGITGYPECIAHTKTPKETLACVDKIMKKAFER